MWRDVNAPKEITWDIVDVCLFAARVSYQFRSSNAPRRAEKTTGRDWPSDLVANDLIMLTLLSPNDLVELGVRLKGNEWGGHYVLHRRWGVSFVVALRKFRAAPPRQRKKH